MDMRFLLRVRPEAGHDQEVMDAVRKTFGADAKIDFLEELSDVYVMVEATPGALAQFRAVQATDHVLDTDLEVVNIVHKVDGDTRVDSCFAIWIMAHTGRVQEAVDALVDLSKKPFDGGVQIDLICEVFSDYADIIALVAVNTRSAYHVAKPIRDIDAVKDTVVYALRRIDEM
jgi:hypothetical protein